MAWIIHSKTKLWSGKGIVPGPINKMFSGLAEAYRVLTALSFLQNYVNQFPQTFQKQPWVYLCCNNLGVITCINNETNYLVQPNQMIQDEYGIYQTIKEIAQSLHPANLQFVHVLGHQDNQTKKKPLTLEERLNIKCNAAAIKMHSQLIPANYPKHHPFIACTCPYLTISDNHIIWQTKQTTQDAYAIIKYNEYVTKKYTWNQAMLTNIVWQALHIAINRFTANQQQVLQKFIHGWLPLQTRL